MKPEFDAGHIRARKARLAKRLGRAGTLGSSLLAGLLVIAAAAMLASGAPLAHLAGALAVIGVLWVLWLKGDLSCPQGKAPSSDAPLEEVLDPWLLGRLTGKETPAQLWDLAKGEWRGQFVIIRTGIHPEDVAACLGTDPTGTWAVARALAARHEAPSVHPGHLAAAILGHPEVEPLLRGTGLDPAEVLRVVPAWIDRFLRDLERERPLYGGLGRDWASGFTPTLERYATNMSRAIARSGAHFGTLAAHQVIDQIITALGSGKQPVALIGEIGTGKTTIMTAMAQRLIEGDGGSIAYRQVMMLDAGAVAAGSAGTGDTERLILTALGEAVHAGNIVLALDDADSFLRSGTGAVDLSALLLSVLQSRRLPMVLALSPAQWQDLLARNPALAGTMLPVTVPEPPRDEVLGILADTALTLESRYPGRAISFSALTESYDLAGRYFNESAHPGRSIKVLEAALSRSAAPLVTRREVQAAIESMLGVKVGDAQGPETDVLLGLEGKIHERMIGQERAVEVVAAALRRARAGVASTKRPAGSFLFLGPTGVGKTELAKSLAAVYFGNEKNMVRLDMSEYGGAGDAARLLGTEAGSFAVAVREHPFSVVLLDELEKAHPNVLNLLLQLLDEGRLTDTAGREVRFRDAIIIATSNAGADEIRKHLKKGEDPEKFEAKLLDTLISDGTFKPELLNRFDDIVTFRPLTPNELGRVVRLMLGEVNANLASRQIRVELSDAAVTRLVKDGNDPRLGARPMRRIVQRRVENAAATRLLKGELSSGGTLVLDEDDVAGE